MSNILLSFSSSNPSLSHLLLTNNNCKSTTIPINQTENYSQIEQIVSSKFQNLNKNIKNEIINLNKQTKFNRLQTKKTIQKKTITCVERRNARERTRVHTVNHAFLQLKRMLPSLAKNVKRVSKLKILRTSIQYIYQLISILGQNTQKLDG
uniref:BHLH domain-containing protein n=1 Tax=Meloidogyne enterolobii TaxID=390850 RepID=A0A6V7WQM3_MELEN|nr:unnamed protein product [Meloidogyne enterolobii]